jgi:hypothetical protein
MQSCNFWDYDYGWVGSIHDWVLFQKTYVHMKPYDDKQILTKYKLIKGVVYSMQPLFYSFIKSEEDGLPRYETHWNSI